jgi:hypothetical protein
MKRRTFLVTEKKDLKDLDDLLLNGWVPEKAYSTDQNYLLLLALPEEEDEQRKPGELEDVESLRDVLLPDVDRMLGEGYRIHAVYAKNCIMVKRRVPVAAAGVV